MAEKIDSLPRTTDRGDRVPVDVNGHRIYLWADVESVPKTLGDEVEIGAERLSLDRVLGDLSALASTMSEGLKSSGASRVIIEFGCEFALESGTLIAVIGKATTKSMFKVGLEWTRPTS